MKRDWDNRVSITVLGLFLGALSFAQKDAKAGASGTTTDTPSNGKSTTEAVTDAATQQAEEEAKRPALTIHKPEDIEALPEQEKQELTKQAQTRASVGAGTVGVYIKPDGTETTNKEEAKRAMGGTGRAIAKYTPPRPPNVVAAEELLRMYRLAWSRAAREAVNKRMSGRKTPLSEEELIKILKENGAPVSYLRPKASKRLAARVLAFVQAGPLPATSGEQAESEKLATVN